MADDRVEVSFGADTSQLTGNLASGAASAKASFDGIKISAADFSKALQAAGGDLTKVKLDLDSAASAAKSVGAGMVDAGRQAKAGMNEAASAAGEAESAHGRLRLATAGVTREFIVLGHEAVTGNFSRIPGSLLVLMERMGGLRLSMIGVIAPIAAAGVALFEIVKHAREAADALKAVQSAATFNNTPIGDEQIKSFIDQVRRMRGETVKDAEEVVATFARMRGATAPLIQTMIDQVQLYAAATGEKLPQAAKQLAAAFADPIAEGDAFLHRINASRTAVQQFDAVAAKGDSVAALTEMLNALATATGRVEERTHGATEAQRHMAEIRARVFGLGADQQGAEVVQARKLAELEQITRDRAAKVAQDISRAQAAAGDNAAAAPTGAPLQQVREQAAALKDATDKTNAEILAAEVKLWQDRIAVGDLYGNQLREAQTALDRAIAEQRRAAGQEAIAAARTSISELQAQGTLGRTQLLKAEADKWSALLAGDKLTANQRIEIQRQLNTTLTQLHGSERGEHLKALEAVTDAARRGSEARVHAAQAEVDFTTRIWKEGSDQQIAAQKRLTEAQQQFFDRNAANAQAEQDRQFAAATAEIDRREKVVQERARLGQISTADEINQLRAIEAQRLQIIEATAQAEQAIWAGNEQKLEEIESRFLHFKQQSETRMTQFTNQAATQETRTWDRAFRPIEAGFNTMISGMIRGHQKFTQAALSGIGTWLEREISSASQVLFHKLTLYAADALAKEQAETAKQAAEETTNSLGLFSLASKAIKAIISYAGEAFAGTYSALSGIPYVGPFIAPPAAAAAEAAVVGATSLVSAEGGMWTVPNDMIANIHRDESVLPADIAGPMRSFFGGGQQGGGGNTYGDTHFHAPLVQAYGAQATPDQIATAVAQAIRNFHPAFRTTRI